MIFTQVIFSLETLCCSHLCESEFYGEISQANLELLLETFALFDILNHNIRWNIFDTNDMFRSLCMSYSIFSLCLQQISCNFDNDYKTYLHATVFILTCISINQVHVHQISHYFVVLSYEYTNLTIWKRRYTYTLYTTVHQYLKTWCNTIKALIFLLYF